MVQRMDIQIKKVNESDAYNIVEEAFIGGLVVCLLVNYYN